MYRALLLFFLFLFLARAVWRLVGGIAQGALGGSQEAGRSQRQAPAAVKMTPCPVCGTYVVPGKALSAVSQGHMVYFCSETCRKAHAA